MVGKVVRGAFPSEASINGDDGMGGEGEEGPGGKFFKVIQLRPFLLLLLNPKKERPKPAGGGGSWGLKAPWGRRGR